MKVEIDTSFGRDAKKLPDSVRQEVKAVYKAIEEAQSLDELSMFCQSGAKRWFHEITIP